MQAATATYLTKEGKRLTRKHLKASQMVILEREYQRDANWETEKINQLAD